MNKSKILIKWCACSLLVLGGLLLVVSPVFADLSDDTNNLKSQWSGACAQSGGNAPGCGGGSSDTSSSSDAPAAAPAPAPAPSPSPMEQAELGAAQQIGYSIGQNIAQALFGFPQTPAQQAAQQEQQREIAAQQAYAAQQAAIAEQQREEEIARQQQATHDRLVSEMQSDDGTSYGIKGLPGIYLNNSNDNQSGPQNLPLMKDDDSTSTASNENTAAAAGNTTETEGGVQLMKDDDSPSSVPSSPSPAVPPQAQDGLNLMKDDDNSSNAPADNPSGPKAVDFSGVPVKDAHLQDDQAVVPSDSSVVDLREAHTTTVDPSVVNGSSPSLSTINPSPADQALMHHQWEVNIDPRYLSDPDVVQNMNNLWAAARHGNADANGNLINVLADQFKAQGLTPGQISDFLNKFTAIADGEGSIPVQWNSTSSLANSLDGGPGTGFTVRPDNVKPPKYYTQEFTTIGTAESVTAAHIDYKGSGKQTEDDCVIYAIANGAQVPLDQVRDQFKSVVSHLAMDPAAERKNPDMAVSLPDEGGNGGLNGPEELSLAEKFGKVIPVPNDGYARAIANTGRPVLTTVDLDPPKRANHKVLVTGVYRTPDGKIYYSVMDSNLGNDNKNSTDYVEKSFFEDHLASGGFVVMPNEKH